jgi:hypothetical protein
MPEGVVAAVLLGSHKSLGPPPLLLVLFYLFGSWVLFYRVCFDREVVSWVVFENLGVALDILFEDFRDLGVFEDRLPWTRGLTCCTVDALVGMDVKLIGPLLIRDGQLIDAVHWTDFYAFNVFTVDTQLCDHPRHFRFLLSLNGMSVKLGRASSAQAESNGLCKAFQTLIQYFRNVKQRRRLCNIWRKITVTSPRTIVFRKDQAALLGFSRRVESQPSG